MLLKYQRGFNLWYIYTYYLTRESMALGKIPLTKAKHLMCSSRVMWSHKASCWGQYPRELDRDRMLERTLWLPIITWRWLTNNYRWLIGLLYWLTIIYWTIGCLVDWLGDLLSDDCLVDWICRAMIDWLIYFRHSNPKNSK